VALRIALPIATAVVVAVCTGLLGAGPAHAQPAAQPPVQPAVQPALDPPRPVSATTVPYPETAPPHTQPVIVQVLLKLSLEGTVEAVDVAPAPTPADGAELVDRKPFEGAVAAAAKGFVFTPARYGGKPVAVTLTFKHTFLPPPPKPTSAPDGGPPLDCVLRGKLVEKGTRAPVSRATVTAWLGERKYTADSDERGRFRLPLPQGTLKVMVHGPAHLPFLQYETLNANQELAVAYAIERERYDPYEILVYGERRREEISRITLRAAEIRQVPGTFGDPFRVVQTLPGVASIMSLLPFPIVRGASPGSTGFLVDGTRVPLLYHLLAGPSVIHPEFVDEIQFYPGQAPVQYGGYTAGVVDGRTRRAGKDESLTDLDANLLQTGGFLRRPLPWIDATGTIAGRVGYPGIVMSLATDEASLSYWDYQARLDGGNARRGWTVFAFGASDEVQAVPQDATPTTDGSTPPLETALRLSFHRLDLRAMYGKGPWDVIARLVLGRDDTLFSKEETITTWIAEPSVRGRWKFGQELELAGGIEGGFKQYDQTLTTSGNAPDEAQADLFPEDLSKFASGTAFAEALWRPSPVWLVRPGLRGDLLWDGTTTAGSFDPRLAVRRRLWEVDPPLDVTATGDARAVWLKGGVGVFHQPPRFFLPIPGLDTMPLRFGLLQAIQSSLGVEVPVARNFDVTAEGYFNWMDPVVFDLSTNQDSVTNAAQQTGQGQVQEDSGGGGPGAAFERLLKPQRGRAMGLEVMVRRQARSGPYGWLAYTLSLSQREREGAWVAYDYDRTHLVNLVCGLPLPRNWDLGVRLQYQSGKPATTSYGYNTARIDGYLRFDVRIDKRAVWNKWLFDFYVDLTNIALHPEEVAPGNTIRYVLPTLGVRARL
jgi:hypothetical protein